MRSGYYNLMVQFKDNGKTEIVYVKPNDISIAKLTLIRKIHFNIEPDLSNIWINKINYIGPAISFGISHKSISINYCRYFLNNSKNISPGSGIFFSGSLIECSYRFINLWESLRLSSGIIAGNFYYETGLYGRDHIFYQYMQGHYYGGPHLSATAIWKYIYLKIKYCLLIGQPIGNILDIGTGIEY
jgi:hypothetical protein